MNKSAPIVLFTIAVPLSLALATSGCATKKYVRQQVAPVNQKVAKLETQTNEQIGWLTNKHNTDISEVRERISTTDQRVAQVGNVADQAQGTASRAMQQTETNASAIQANSSAIESNSAQVSTLATGVANALNYQLIEKGDVTFGFNKSTLTPEAKVALDAMAAKAQSLPRSVIELAGFTDKIGSESYNLALSRRRAEAVQRYLVLQKVPLRSIHIVGLGEEAPPENLEAVQALTNPNPSRQDIQRLARRVRINVYGAGDITAGTASRSQQ